jgi:tetratricopeptide (TPR) repeat protein
VTLGAVFVFTGRAAQSIAEFERALALNPNFATAHGFIGCAKYYLGRGVETEAHVQEAFRLSPKRYLCTVVDGMGRLKQVEPRRGC